MSRSTSRFAWALFGVAAPVLLLCGMAYANRAPLPPPEKPEPPFVKVIATPGLKKAELVIPKKFVGGGEKADAGMSPTRTAIAGVAISGAVALLGLQLVRRRSGQTGRAPLMVVAGLIGFTAISAAALADIAIPGQPRRPRPQPPQPPIEVPNNVPVVVTIIEHGDTITLRIAPEHLGGPAPLPVPGNAAPEGAVPGGAPAPIEPNRPSSLPPPPG